MSESTCKHRHAEYSETLQARYCPDCRTVVGLSEKQFQRDVEKLAKALGWKVMHHRISQFTEPGWPDLFCLHAKTGRCVALELKTNRGKVSDAQQAWIDALNACGIKAYVTRPNEMDWLIALLGGAAGA